MHMESTLGGGTFMRHEPSQDVSGGASEAQLARGTPIRETETNQMHAQVSAVMAENRELRAEVDQLRADRARIAEIQSRLMEVLGSKSPDRLVHDVRNVLNERELYRALADSVM